MATSPASIAARPRPVAAAYRSAMARAEATASSVVPGATRIWPISPARNVAPRWITPSITRAAASPVPIGTNNATPAPAAAPNVASATPAGAHVVADRDGPPRLGHEALTHRDVAPSHRHREPPDSGVVDDPGERHAHSGDVEAELGALVDEAGGDRGDVVEHRFRAVLATARHATKHAQPGRPEDPRLQRRSPDVDGDDGEAIDARAHLSAARRRE